MFWFGLNMFGLNATDLTSRQTFAKFYTILMFNLNLKKIEN